MTEVDRYDSSSVSDPADEVSSTTYSYDGSGNMTGETDYIDMTGSGGTIVYSYEYDGANRTTQELRQDSSTTTTTTYEYNANGQTTQVAVDGTVTGSYAYDPAGLLDDAGTTIVNGQITNDGTWAYSYDSVGNVTEMSKGSATTTWEYTYNLNNQVLSATEYSSGTTMTSATLLQTVTFAYDVFGNMIAQTTTPGGGSPSTSQYAYDIGAGDQMYAALSAGNITERYMYMLDPSSAAAVGSGVSGITYFAMNDNEDSTSDILGANGSLQDNIGYNPVPASTTYDTPIPGLPFTQTNGSASPDATGNIPFAYQGGMYNSATGLNISNGQLTLPDGHTSGMTSGSSISASGGTLNGTGSVTVGTAGFSTSLAPCPMVGHLLF